MAPHTLLPLETESAFDSHVSTLSPSTLLVIYFHAPWAEPCKQMSTILTTLASTYDTEKRGSQLSFVALDAEEVADISERYDVTQVPLVVLQRDGATVDSVAGTDAARVRSAVEKFAGAPTSVATGGVNGSTAPAVLPPAQQVTKPAVEETKSGVENGDGGPQLQDGQELQARLAELVKAAPVMLFMKGTPSAPQCGFSRQTVGLLRERGVRYGFFNILADDEVRQGLKEFSEWPTFPQVYVDGELVGGLDILKEEFENDADFLRDYSVQTKHAQAQAQAQAA